MLGDWNLRILDVLWNSGRELFLSDASLFVDDVEAIDVYDREDEEPASVQTSAPSQEVVILNPSICWFFSCVEDSLSVGHIVHVNNYHRLHLVDRVVEQGLYVTFSIFSFQIGQ